MKFELALLLAIALVFVIPIIGAVNIKIAEDKGKRYKKKREHNPYLEYLHSKNKSKNILKDRNNEQKDEYLEKAE